MSVCRAPNPVVLSDAARYGAACVGLCLPEHQQIGVAFTVLAFLLTEAIQDGEELTKKWVDKKRNAVPLSIARRSHPKPATAYRATMTTESYRT